MQLPLRGTNRPVESPLPPSRRSLHPSSSLVPSVPSRRVSRPTGHPLCVLKTSSPYERGVYLPLSLSFSFFISPETPALAPHEVPHTRKVVKTLRGREDGTHFAPGLYLVARAQTRTCTARSRLHSTAPWQLRTCCAIVFHRALPGQGPTGDLPAIAINTRVSGNRVTEFLLEIRRIFRPKCEFTCILTENKDPGKNNVCKINPSYRIGFVSIPKISFLLCVYAIRSRRRACDRVENPFY